MFRFQELYSKRVGSQILIKELSFCYKVCHKFKSIKAMKENITHICKPFTSEDLG